MTADKDTIDWCKKMYDSNMKLLKKINHKNNASNIGLTREQVKQLGIYIAEAIETKGKSVGSYRYLIYTILESVGYIDGMDMGLLDLNNALCDLGD